MYVIVRKWENLGKAEKVGKFCESWELFLYLDGDSDQCGKNSKTQNGRHFGGGEFFF